MQKQNSVKMNDWNSTFYTEVKESGIQDNWHLSEDPSILVRGQHYKTHIFGSFCCSYCRNSWSSSKIFVLFLINLRQRRGTVKMRIFRQNCKKCAYSQMEDPKITPENIERVIINLVKRIQRKCYNIYDPKEDLGLKTYGYLDGPHEKKFCEACRNGLCEAEDDSGTYRMQAQKVSGREEKDEGPSLATIFGGLALGAAVLVGAFAVGNVLTNKDEEEKKKNKK